MILDRDADVACDLSSERQPAPPRRVLDATAAATSRALRRGVRPGDDREVDAATWRRVQAVNVESALWLVQAFAPGMAERRFGRIVFIASDTVWSPPNPAMLAYIASKGALLGVMRTLAVTLGADGIAVSAVAPGLTDTPRRPHQERRRTLRRGRRPPGAQAPAHSRRYRAPPLRTWSLTRPRP